MPGKVSGGELLIDSHVGDRQGHVPRLVAEEQIGGRGSPRHVERPAQVNPQPLAGVHHLPGVGVLSQRRQQGDLDPQQPQVMGNVPPHAPHAHRNLAGVGIPPHQRAGGLPPDVHIHRAGHHHVAAGGQDVAPAHNVALLHQVGDMHRHRRAGNPRPLGQGLLGDHRVLCNPVQNLLLPLGHPLTSISKSFIFRHLFILSQFLFLSRGISSVPTGSALPRPFLPGPQNNHFISLHKIALPMKRRTG